MQRNERSNQHQCAVTCGRHPLEAMLGSGRFAGSGVEFSTGHPHLAHAIRPSSARTLR
jgi:hypothetical protein